MGLPKMKFTSNTIGMLILAVTIAMIIASLHYDATPPSEVPEPPVPPVEPLKPVGPELPLMSVVEVSVESSGGMFQGGGLRVGDIVVTSVMIFIGNDQIITVDGIKTDIVKRDDNLGLVALRSDVTVENLNEYFNEVPCPPVGSQTKIAGPRDYRVRIFRYMSEMDRMIISGDVPAHAAGYPVMFGIDVVGIVVGLNSANVRQGIAVSRQGLMKFIRGDE